MNLKVVEREMDNLSRVEESFEQMVEKFQLPLEVRKPLYSYLRLLYKNGETMQSMLKEEIVLKEKYHSEVIDLKLICRETDLKNEAIELKLEKIEESNKAITTENEQLMLENTALNRRTRKLNTHMGKIQAAQSMIYAETTKFAE